MKISGPVLTNSPDEVLYQSTLYRYSELPLPADIIIATYIWVDGTGQHIRCKDRTLKYVPKEPTDKLTLILDAINAECWHNTEKYINYTHLNRHVPPHFCPRDLDSVYQVECVTRGKENGRINTFNENFKELPIWNFDGSSTGQSDLQDSDIFLYPRTIYRNPFRRGNNILVMCDTYTFNMEPTATNHRAKCQEAYEQCKDEEPWFGIEQQFMLLDSDLRFLGWPRGGFPPPQGPYYCGVGANKMSGRDLLEAHYKCCLYAGVPMSGINAEVTPSQWEFQLSYAEGVTAGDDLWVARYILHKLAEEYEVNLSFDPKPARNWHGSGAHVNFSTKMMREDNGIMEIEKAISKLSKAHMKHIQVYDPHGGKDNARRLTGLNETTGINDFSTGVANRSTSIRIPRTVSNLKKGYMEDQRPAANSDPYCVINALLRTCLLNE